MSSENRLSSLAQHHSIKEFKELSWTGSFEDYLDIVADNPRVLRNAWQRLYDMVVAHGMEEYVDNKKKIIRYNFFSDEGADGKDAIFGLEIPVMKLMDVFKAAAQGFGPEKRILLLHGPVGSAKSTVVRLLKKGLEKYTRSPEGALYSFEWVLPSEHSDETFVSPVHEEPLLLIPHEWRHTAMEELGLLNYEYPLHHLLNQDLCPPSRFYFQELLGRYEGDWEQMISKHIRVRRLAFSEKDRVGIGTFQPKDEKNQDSTELTGDINYRKIAEYGSDSDPRAFNFDGEFCIANRGIIEFVEILKLDVAFLYDLLGATQEHKIKPKKFAQTDIDEVIIGHTNEAEYRRLLNNEFMEALRDRTIKIDIPYITRVDEEVRIYDKDFNNESVKGVHIAPHTLEVAAMWAVLSRLEEPNRPNLSIIQKMKLYNGKSLPGYTADNIKELRKEARREGMLGISARYVQDKISNALVAREGHGSINPFMVMNALISGLKTHSLINDEETKKRYRELMSLVKQEYEDIIKNEVQRAISADEEAIEHLCSNYVDNVKAYTQRERVQNQYTGQSEDPDERLMRAIEEKIGVPEARKDDFRREIMNYIGALAVEGKTFDYRSNERLRKALELKLFEDQKDTIKLSTLVSNVVDRETQSKIDVVKQRLIRDYGYNEESATDVLNYVASIFARGDAKEGD
ncbi:MAG: serine protein kinase [Myxococcales bacterium]|nr:serine protein kinase [Myxococcales bacterium]|tara:strand:+ start:1154 stop:3208 length:2055 start_codon:yes stop_codon:yes gene_type:complete